LASDRATVGAAKRLLKIVENSCCYFGRISDDGRVLLDSLSLSRHGESSSELSSVMILNPAFGNSLWKVTVCRTVKHHI
jgi:hypothetical protein